MKRCPTCKQTLPLDTFGKNKGRHDGRQGICRPCFTARYNRGDTKRDYHLQSRYGISSKQYDIMLADQKGVCKICCTDRPGGKGDYFHVDHCHDSGNVRALLCNQCNTALGLFKDNPELLTNAIEYLNRFQPATTA